MKLKCVIDDTELLQAKKKINLNVEGYLGNLKSVIVE